MITTNIRPARWSERVRRAVAAIAGGGLVVVVVDDHRTDESALVFAAQLATARLMSFTNNTPRRHCTRICEHETYGEGSESSPLAAGRLGGTERRQPRRAPDPARW